MNKTFKVVYNKARGMLTAVNEAASCVQAKGTKTVVAAAAIAALSGAVQAADSNPAEGVSITPVYGAGAYVGDEGFVTTSKKVAIEQTDKNTWKVTADGFGAEEDAIYGAAVNNSTDAYAHGVDEVHIADGSSFKGGSINWLFPGLPNNVALKPSDLHLFLEFLQKFVAFSSFLFIIECNCYTR